MVCKKINIAVLVISLVIGLVLGQASSDEVPHSLGLFITWIIFFVIAAGLLTYALYFAAWLEDREACEFFCFGGCCLFLCVCMPCFIAWAVLMAPVWQGVCIGQWEVGLCSVSCGGGLQTETYRISFDYSSGGEACPHARNAERSKPCNLNPCPVSCIGGWKADSAKCSVSCGDGMRMETFRISRSAANGGKACPHGQNEERSKSCNLGACPCESFDGYFSCPQMDCSWNTQAKQCRKRCVKDNDCAMDPMDTTKTYCDTSHGTCATCPYNQVELPNCASECGHRICSENGSLCNPKPRPCAAKDANDLGAVDECAKVDRKAGCDNQAACQWMSDKDLVFGQTCGGKDYCERFKIHDRDTCENQIGCELKVTSLPQAKVAFCQLELVSQLELDSLSISAPPQFDATCGRHGSYRPCVGGQQCPSDRAECDKLCLATKDQSACGQQMICTWRPTDACDCDSFWFGATCSSPCFTHLSSVDGCSSTLTANGPSAQELCPHLVFVFAGPDDPLCNERCQAMHGVRSSVDQLALVSMLDIIFAVLGLSGFIFIFGDPAYRTLGQCILLASLLADLGLQMAELIIAYSSPAYELTDMLLNSEKYSPCLSKRGFANVEQIKGSFETIIWLGWIQFVLAMIAAAVDAMDILRASAIVGDDVVPSTHKPRYTFSMLILATVDVLNVMLTVIDYAKFVVGELLPASDSILMQTEDVSWCFKPTKQCPGTGANAVEVSASFHHQAATVLFAIAAFHALRSAQRF